MSDLKQILVSVIVPLKDAAGYVDALLAELVEVLGEHFDDFEVVVVDDASQDETGEKVLELIKELPNLQYYCLSRPVGLDAALVAGLDNCIGDWVVTMDPLEDPPQAIPEMVALAAEGHDMVYGLAEGVRRPGASFLYMLFLRLYHRLFRLAAGMDLPRNITGFRVLSRRIVNHIIPHPHRHELLRVLPALIGFEHAAYPYRPLSRYGGGSRRSLLDGVSSGAGILLTASARPLRAASVLSLIAASLNLFYSAYIFLIALLKNDVAEGWITLSAQAAGMFFLFSLILAMISETLHRITTEVSGPRPYYISCEASSVGLSRIRDLNLLDESGGWRSAGNHGDERPADGQGRA